MFTRHGTHSKPATIPAACLDICQVQSITVLGVMLNDKLTAADHVSSLLPSCSSTLYALRVLHDYELSTSLLQDVFCTTVIAKITYCAPSGLVASARQMTVHDWTHACDAANVNDTVLMTFWRLANCLLQPVNHYYMYSSNNYNLHPNQHNRQHEICTHQWLFVCNQNAVQRL